MRSLITGIIGAGASSAGWLAFEHSQQQSYGWLVCLIGLVTGVAVHSGAKGPSGGTMRGALAVLLTLAGIVGGQKAYAMYMQSSSTASQAAEIELNTQPAEGNEDEGAGDTTATRSADVELPEDIRGGGAADYSKSAMKKNFSEWDMVWMSLAALAAYITGKGGEKKAPTPATEEQPANPAGEPESAESDEG